MSTSHISNPSWFPLQDITPEEEKRIRIFFEEIDEKSDVEVYGKRF